MPKYMKPNVVRSNVIKGQDYGYHWALTLDCGHTVFRQANRRYKYKPHKAVKCEICKPPSNVRILQNDPGRYKINRQEGRTNELLVCHRCGYKTYRPKAMHFHHTMGCQLSDCGCGLIRVRITVTIPYDPIEKGYRVVHYCPRCDVAYHAKVIEGEAQICPVPEDMLARARNIFTSVQNQKGVRPYAKTVPNRKTDLQAPRSIEEQPERQLSV